MGEPLDDDLQASNDARIRALAEGGMGISPQSLNDLRILAYLETLLGDRIDDAIRHFQVLVADQLDGAEAQAEAIRSMQRQQALLTGGLPLDGRGLRG